VSIDPLVLFVSLGFLFWSMSIYFYWKRESTIASTLKEKVTGLVQDQRSKYSNLTEEQRKNLERIDFMMEKLKGIELRMATSRPKRVEVTFPTGVSVQTHRLPEAPKQAIRTAAKKLKEMEQ
jgi:hypothetical protein